MSDQTRREEKSPAFRSTPVGVVIDAISTRLHIVESMQEGTGDALNALRGRLAVLREQLSGEGGWVEVFDAQLREHTASVEADYAALRRRVDALWVRPRDDAMMAAAGEAALHRSIEDQIKQLNELRSAFADSERANLDLRAEIERQQLALSHAGDVNMGRQKTINQLTGRVDHLENQIDRLACYLLQHHPAAITEGGAVEVAIRLLEMDAESSNQLRDELDRMGRVIHDRDRLVAKLSSEIDTMMRIHPADRLHLLNDDALVAVAQRADALCYERGLPCTECPRALKAEQRRAVVALADVLGMRSGGDVPAAAKAAERVGGPGQADRNDHAAGAQSSGNTLADADDAPAPDLRPTPSGQEFPRPVQSCPNRRTWTTTASPPNSAAQRPAPSSPGG